ncbi:EAL domain-containing protein [Undibacterium pigrum]|uniref:PAS domain S-box-containing protein/diguanylate cyclase (GGDEF)-like protein n=1 Tax=Undibacterium pigrum TaxID=401470 RepID=A0A318IQU9_9BURK|nr:EAL domain-containing protein [Undibacterium pigrum]PXX37755.1 PAS domain S-box-containing protein/diguanylate cyclase (GGDEF)-like protein [Undibacterium pigrum]
MMTEPREDLSTTVQTALARSMRSYLLILVLAVSLPLIAIVGFGIYHDFQQSTEHTKKSLKIMTNVMLRNTRGKLDQAQKIMTGVARLPLVRRLQLQDCPEKMSNLASLDPSYSRLAITDLQGRILCSARTGSTASMTDISLAEISETIRNGSLTISPPRRVQASAPWSTIMSLPVRNEEQAIIAVVVLSLDVDFYNPAIPAEFLPESSRFGYFREDGIMVWRNLDPDGVIGTRPNAEAARRIVQTKDGEFESLAVDGVRRFFSVSPLPEYGLVAFVGVPSNTVFADARTRAYEAIALTCAMIGLLLVMASFFGRRITRPMSALGRVAKAVRNGDLGARALMEGPEELQTVASEFNRMLAAQQRSDARFRAFLDNSAIVAWIKDEDGRYQFVSDNFLRRFAFHSNQVLGKTDHDFLPTEIAEAYRASDLALLENGMQDEAIWPSVNADGSNSWWLVNKFVFMGSDSKRQLGGLAVDITERKRMTDLDEMILQTAMDAYWLVDKHGNIKAVNETACSMMGYTREEMLALTIDDVDVMLEGHGRTVEERLDNVRLGGAQQFEARHRRKDGRVIDVEVSVRYLPSQQLFPAFVRDITARKQAEQSLHLAATVFESHEGMFVTNADKVIQQVNRAFTEITGYSREDAIGQSPKILNSGRHDPAFFAEMDVHLAKSGSWQGEIWNRHKDGHISPQWLAITAVYGRNHELLHYVGTLVDISMRKAAEDEIKTLAFYDPLTRLPNRRLLTDRLQQALLACARSGRKGALMYIDLDNFKTLNDTQGHYKGDLLLQQVSERLSHCVREGDTVARIGGDEFVVLLENLSEASHEAASQIEMVGKKILVALNQPYELEGYECHSTPSIGATLIAEHDSNYEELMKQADLAMYAAKTAGRNTLRFFDPAMQAVVSSRAQMEKELREALRDQQLRLHYQAQVGRHGELVGAEALVRWQHPQRGMISPAEFIPLAEASGLILPLGQWVLRTACLQLLSWANDSHSAQLTIAVNVSARQFRQADIVEQILGILQETGAKPELLKLELTESLLVDDVEDTIKKMERLKAAGLCFSLDDFGTGYSSLTYLKRLPLDQLKIDQSFVRDVLTDPNDAAIARTIVALSQSMGLSVIAEGVESAEQRDYLASQGCHAYQGYYFGRPMPIADFELARQHMPAGSMPCGSH